MAAGEWEDLTPKPAAGGWEDLTPAAQGAPVARMGQKPITSASGIARGMIGEFVNSIMRPGYPGQQISRVLETVGNYAGENVNDYAAKVYPPQIAAGLGAFTNAAIQVAPGLYGGGNVAASAAPEGKALATRLMQSAVKPTIDDLRTGKAQKAIATMLENGYSPTPAGIDVIKGKIADLGEKVSAITSGSTKTIQQGDIARSLSAVRAEIEKGTMTTDGLASVNKVMDEFINHPAFQKLSEQEAALVKDVASRTAAKISALQDAGRYQSMAAQQQNLAHGGGINTSPTPMNEPYINVGSQALGSGRSLSPSAYPAEAGMIGQPRIPGQYTHNIERVPEAQSASADFLKIVEQRKAEIAAAQQRLDAFRAQGGSTGLPVSAAQDMKQANYKRLTDASYGNGVVLPAEKDALKSLNAELKTQIEKAEPAVAPLNAEMSQLINAKKIGERRAMMELNKNPVSLPAVIAAAGHNPLMTLGMWANSSAWAKSATAHLLYKNPELIKDMARPIGQATGATAEAILQAITREKENKK